MEFRDFRRLALQRGVTGDQLRGGLVRPLLGFCECALCLIANGAEITFLLLKSGICGARFLFDRAFAREILLGRRDMGAEAVGTIARPIFLRIQIISLMDQLLQRRGTG